MMKKIHKTVISAVVVVAVVAGMACMVYALMYSGKEEDVSAAEATALEQTVIEVDTMTLHRETFMKQVLCNGRLAAIRRAELMCPKAGEVVQSVRVRNGQRVEEGAVLAVADTRTHRMALDKAQRDLEKARVELADKLIGLGYDSGGDGVPAEVLRRAEVTSGYYTAKFALRTAEASLDECTLRAPFAGRIADLVARPFQRGDKFGTLIDDSFFDVEFKVLEAELASVSVGTAVRVSPFVNDSLSLAGEVTELNPTIDSKGLVGVKARIRNTSGELLDGMNVKVTIENSVPDMFVVPKEAVVERDGYHVVFVYDAATGRAIWTYVDILYSNLLSFAITGCARKNTSVREGDIVITSGNLNLADDTEVKAVSSKQ